MLRLLNIALCLLLIIQPSLSLAATRLVAPSGGASTGDCTVTPCTFARANSVAISGDSISLNDGTHTVNGFSLIPGVSITGTSANKTLVTLRPADSNAQTAFIMLSSSSLNTVGNQSISHITIDGYPGTGNRYARGIFIKDRDDVSIHNVTIQRFNESTDWYSKSGNTGSYAVHVYSSQNMTPNGDNWPSYWPADSGAIGDDSSITALWPTNPVDNFQMYDFHISDCGGADSNSESGAICVYNVANSSLHDFTIDNTGVNGAPAIKSTPAILTNFDVYNATILQPRKSLNPQIITYGRSPFEIEFWLLRGGCEFYNIYVENGCFSITVGKETTVRDNFLYWEENVAGTDPAPFGSLGMELTQQSYLTATRNRIKGTSYGIVAGIEVNNDSKAFIVTDLYISNNVIYETYSSALKTDNAPDSSYATQLNNVYVYNNDLIGARAGSGWRITQTLNGVINNLIGRNNIIAYNSSRGIYASGTLSNVTITRNAIYSNGSSNTGVTIADPVTLTADPFTSRATGDFTLVSTSLAINNGTNVGANYDDGFSPATTLSPWSVTTADQDDFGSGWELGAYVLTGLAISGGTPTTQQACTADPLTVSLGGITSTANAYCRQTTNSALTTYADIGAGGQFTGGENTTSHSTSVSAACGAVTPFYVICNDGSEDSNTLTVNIDVASSGGHTVPPQTGVRSGGLKTVKGTLVAN